MTRLLKKGAGISFAALLGIGLWADSSFALRAAPTITDQPQGQSVAVGSKAIFSVTVTGQTPFTYRWSFNGTNLNNSSHISGATNASLTVSNLTSADGGNYRVVVKDSLSQSTTSSDAVLTVGSPPVILTSPVNVTKTVGSSASFTTFPTGTDPLICRWRLNGVALPQTNSTHLNGVTNTTLSINGVILSDAGNYTIIVTNQFGATTNSVAVLTVNSPPVVTNQPVSQTNLSGSFSIFTVAAIGTAPLRYRWYFNGSALTDTVRISGTTNTSLVVSNIQSGDAGNYRAIITNGFGSVTSEVAVLTVLASPVITVQPLSQTNGLGNSVAFTGAATGAQPISYQWVRDAVPVTNDARVSGANSGTLTVTALTNSDAGGYRLVAANYLGTNASVTATLTVLPSVCGLFTNGLAVWWPGEGNAYDAVSTNDGVASGGVSYTAGKVGLGMNFTPPAQVVVTAGPTLNMNASGGAGLTLEGWIRPSQFTLTVPQAVMEWNNSGNVGVHLYLSVDTVSPGSGLGNILVDLADTDGNSHPLWTAANVMVTNVFQHIAVTYDRISGLAVIYRNGAVVTNSNLGSFFPWTGTDLYIGNRPVGPFAGSYFNGVLDEWAIYNRALSPAEITSLFTADSLGKCATQPPRFVQLPTNFPGVVDSNVTVTASVAGAPPFIGRWFFNGTLLANGSHYSGADTTTLTILAATTNDIGGYQVIVANNGGSATSSVANLNLHFPPRIITPPVSRVVAAGTNVAFHVVAGGDAPLTYRWRRNGTDLDDSDRVFGTGTSSLGISDLVFADSGDYDVIVSNSFGVVVSPSASLTVPTPVSLTSQPSGSTNVVGGSVSFAAGVYGSQPITSQWFFNNVLLTNDIRVSGATTTNLAVANLQTNDRGNYQLVCANAYGAVTSAVAFLDVQIPPAIVQSPNDRTNLAGTVTVFTVVATGTAPLGYQWYHNNTPLTDNAHVVGSASSNLVISSIQNSDAGNYQAIVTNWAGSATSAVAALTVLSPPVITLQPLSQTNGLGNSVSFTSAATGEQPISYQWLHVGVPLTNDVRVSGVNSGTLTLSGLTNSDAGGYQLVAANYLGTNASAIATLTVVPSVCGLFTNGLAAWWPGEGNLYDAAFTSDGTAQGTISFAAGKVGQGLNFNGSSLVRIPASPRLNIGASNGVTLEGWILPAQFVFKVPQFVMEWNNGGGGIGVELSLSVDTTTAGSGFGSVNVNFVDTTGKGHGLYTAANVMSTNTFQHVAVTYDRGSGMAAIYRNGQMLTNANLGSFTPQTTYDLYLGARASGVFSGSYFSGILDEAAVYNRALSPAEILSLYTADSLGKCSTQPPRIVDSPASFLGAVGSNVTLNVGVAGAAPFNCRWYFKGVLLANGSHYSGADSTALTIVAATTNDIGGYQVIIINSGGSATSSVANLNLFFPPRVITPPVSQTVAAGSNAVFNVVVSGDGPLSYRWRRNGIALADSGHISGSGTDSLTISSLLFADPGDYDVLVSNSVGVVVSPAASLIVPTPLSLITQPLGHTNLVGSGVSFVVSVIGSQPITHQWFFNSVPLTNDVRVSGATTTNLVITNLQTADTGNYQLISANPLGAVTSAVAVLEVDLPPAITQSPGSRTNVTGSVSVFTVTATGSAPLRYQWFYNNIPLTDTTRINGSTSNSLVVSGIQNGDAGNYLVVISNFVGSVTSTTAALVVVSPPSISQQPVSQMGTLGYFASFAGAATGTQPISYQWLHDGVSLTDDARSYGASSNTLTLTGLTNSDAGDYQLVAFNYLGSTTSVVATLTVEPPVCAAFTNELAAWWPGESNLFDVAFTNNGVAQGSIGFAGGMVGLGLNFDGSSRIRVPANPRLNIGTGSGVTLEGWIQPAQFVFKVPQFVMEWNNGGGGIGAQLSLSVDTTTAGSGLGNIVANFVDTAGTGHGLYTAANVMITNTFQHVAVTYDRSSGVAAIYRNGQMLTNANLGSFIPQTTYDLYLGARASGSFSGSYFSGVLDEAAVYNRALSPVEVLSLYTAGGLGKCTPPPSIVQFPANFLGAVGSNVTINVGAAGVPLFSGQWFFNGVMLTNGDHYSGAGSLALTILGATTNDIGSYQVVVANGGGSVTSSVANLNVLYPPNIITPPVPQTVAAGSSAVFNVVAGGDGPLTYRWRHNGTVLADSGHISGSGTTSVMVSGLGFTDTGDYDVLVSNSVGVVVSPPAFLTVNIAPAITSQPTNRFVALGLPLNLVVGIAGTAPLGYQWSLNGTDLPAGTNAVYSVPAMTTNDYGAYRVIATNVFGAVTSAPIQVVPSMVVVWGAGTSGQTNLLPTLTNIVAVAAGGTPYSPPFTIPAGHNLVLRDDGQVTVWGNNSNGQTNVPAGATNIVAIAAGGSHNLALRGDGRVIAWGNNGNGQLNVPSSLSNVVAIAAGTFHSVALRSDGKVFVWGNSSYGLLNVPANLGRAVSVASGPYHITAVRTDGSVVSWGGNPGPDPRQITTLSFTSPSGLKDINRVAAGFYHDLALRSDGTLVAWGSTNYGLAVVPAFSNATAVSAGNYFDVALRADSRVSAWGTNDFGQTNLPEGLSNVVMISAGPAHVMALVSDGRPIITGPPIGGTSWAGRDYKFSATVTGQSPLALQWQFNGADIPGATSSTLTLLQLDPGQTGTYRLVVSNALGVAFSVPVPLTVVSNGLSFLSALPATGTNFVGGKLWLSAEAAGNGPVNYQWRFNGSALEGATNTDLVIEPLLLAHGGTYSLALSNPLTGSNITSGNSSQSVALLRTWGYNAISPPTNMPSKIFALAASYSGQASPYGYYWALGSDGKLNGWGTSQYGEGNVPASLSNSIVTAVAAGFQHALALRSDGSVVRWGYPTGSVQTNPPAVDNAISVGIACGDGHDMAVRSDGTVAVWGTATVTLTNVPTDATNIIAVAAGSIHCLALRDDGRVIGWGAGSQTNIPPNLSNVIAIATGPGSTISVALRADGTVTKWGSATNVVIPADWTNIVAISSSASHLTALRGDGVVLTSGSYYVNAATVPSGTENVVAIASGGDHDVALFSARTPAVTIQPFGRRVLRGSNTTLLARSVSPVPASYQWLLNGTPLLDATNQTLTVTNAQLLNSGDYQFVVNNSYGSATSKVARLVVTLPLGESLDTSDPNWNNWSNSGGLPWFGQTITTHDGVDAAQSGGIGHAQETVLQTLVTNTTLAGGMASFWWKVSSEAGFDMLEFRLNGALLATNSGEMDWEKRAFEVPIGPSVLQWRYSKNASNSFGADAAWVDQFDITFGSPVITTQPTNQTATAGNGASFMVGATGGGGSLTYSWVHNLTNAVGGNSPILTLAGLTRSDRGTYTCVVSNIYGTVVSSDAILNVKAPQSLTAALLPNGGVSLTSQDADGGLLSESDLANFEVQASETLQDWTTLTNALSITNGMLILQDDGATNHPMRFYRIIEH